MSIYVDSFGNFYQCQEEENNNNNYVEQNDDYSPLYDNSGWCSRFN